MIIQMFKVSDDFARSLWGHFARTDWGNLPEDWVQIGRLP